MSHPMPIATVYLLLVPIVTSLVALGACQSTPPTATPLPPITTPLPPQENPLLLGGLMSLDDQIRHMTEEEFRQWLAAHTALGEKIRAMTEEEFRQDRERVTTGVVYLRWASESEYETGDFWQDVRLFMMRDMPEADFRYWLASSVANEEHIRDMTEAEFRQWLEVVSVSAEHIRAMTDDEYFQAQRAANGTLTRGSWEEYLQCGQPCHYPAQGLMALHRDPV